MYIFTQATNNKLKVRHSSNWISRYIWIALAVSNYYRLWPGASSWAQIVGSCVKTGSIPLGIFLIPGIGENKSKLNTVNKKKNFLNTNCSRPIQLEPVNSPLSLLSRRLACQSGFGHLHAWENMVEQLCSAHKAASLGWKK